MKNTIILVAAILSLNTQVRAGSNDPVKASINSDFVIQLPADVPLADIYIADISALAFKSAEDAISFFDMFSENVVTYQVRYPENKLVMYLNKDVMPDWQLKEWNTYFENRAIKMQSVFDSMYK